MTNKSAKKKQAANNTQKGKNNAKKNNKGSSPEEQARLERKKFLQFWTSLSHTARKRIVRVEKQELLKKIKEKHRHICSCTVCGRKRAVIDREVERLYDQYCAELEYNTTKLQSTPNVNMISETQPMLQVSSNQQRRPPPTTEVVPSTSSSEPPLDNSNEEDSYDDPEEENEDWSDVEDQNSEDLIRYNFGKNLYVDQGAISVSDDWLRENSNNIIEVLYKYFVQSDSGDGLELMMMGTSTAPKHQHRRPSLKRDDVDIDDGTYSEEEEEEEDADEEEEEEEEEEEDEEEDEEDIQAQNEAEEKKWRESKKMFRMYAAKLFYEKIVMAYREKLALEMQNILIQEEEEREKQRKNKEKKVRDNKIKKQKKDEEREKKKKEKEKEEAEKKREEAEKQRLLREAQREEMERKRMEEERSKIEAQMIEMVRKNIENQQRLERERQEELERQRLQQQQQQQQQAEDEAKSTKSKKVKKQKKEEDRKEKRKSQPAPKKVEPVIKQVYLESRPENIVEDVITKPQKFNKTQPVTVKHDEPSPVDPIVHVVSPRKLQQPPVQQQRTDSSSMWATTSFHTLLSSPQQQQLKTSLDGNIRVVNPAKQVTTPQHTIGNIGSMFGYNQIGYSHLPLDEFGSYGQQMWPSKPQPVVNGHNFVFAAPFAPMQPHIIPAQLPQQQQYKPAPIDNEWNSAPGPSNYVPKASWGDIQLGNHPLSLGEAVIRPQQQPLQNQWGFGAQHPMSQQSQTTSNDFQLFGNAMNWLG
jgi:hypothetical protein